MQPDLVVLPKDRTAPDRTLKRLVFERGGIPAYWLVDPLTPSLTVLELREGRTPRSPS